VRGEVDGGSGERRGRKQEDPGGPRRERAAAGHRGKAEAAGSDGGDGDERARNSSNGSLERRRRGQRAGGFVRMLQRSCCERGTKPLGERLANGGRLSRER
jgi:hypothetical protein